jgi:hypothetical protein
MERWNIDGLVLSQFPRKEKKKKKRKESQRTIMLMRLVAGNKPAYIHDWSAFVPSFINEKIWTKRESGHNEKKKLERESGKDNEV